MAVINIFNLSRRETRVWRSSAGDQRDPAEENVLMIYSV